MIRAAAVVLAAAVLASCSSSGGGSAQADVSTFRCPAAAKVGPALGKTVGTVKQSKSASRTIICSYSTASLDGSAFVSITFGAGRLDFEAALKILGSKKQTPVSGLGDQATVVTDGEVRQLIVRGGSRLFTVTTVPDDTAHETAVARVFL